MDDSWADRQGHQEQGSDGLICWPRIIEGDRHVSDKSLEGSGIVWQNA